MNSNSGYKVTAEQWWGVSIRSRTCFSIKLFNDTQLLLHNIALRSGKSAEFYVSVNDQEPVFLATLVKDRAPQAHLNVTIDPGCSVSLLCNNGDGALDVCGTLRLVECPAPAEGAEDSDALELMQEDDSDDESSEDDNDADDILEISEEEVERLAREAVMAFDRENRRRQQQARRPRPPLTRGKRNYYWF